MSLIRTSVQIILSTGGVFFRLVSRIFLCFRNDALEHIILAILARRKMRSVFIVLVTLSSASVVTSCIWTTPPPCRSRCTPPRPPPPTLAWETTISSAQAGNQVVWAVSCNGPCRNLRAELTTSSGDADLYANEDDHPSLGGYQCPTCSMCEAVTADLDDTCSNMASSGNRLVCNHHKLTIF